MNITQQLLGKRYKALMNIAKVFEGKVFDAGTVEERKVMSILINEGLLIRKKDQMDLTTAAKLKNRGAVDNE